MTTTHETDSTVPFWMVATSDTRLPAIPAEGSLTAERLSELRSVLALFAEHPIVTLEAHPVPKALDRSGAMPLDAMSPLAQHLSRLIGQFATSSGGPASVKPAAVVDAAEEVLYKMVVPAKHANGFAKGLIKPMASKTVDGGILSGLKNSSRIVDHAVFVPFGKTAAPVGGAATGVAAGGVATGTAAVGAGATIGAALTVAAPLVLMAVAVGMSAQAEVNRTAAIARITKLLDSMKEEKLRDERNDLDGCRGAIDKATAILLDRGKIGASLGLDSAAYAIEQQLERTRGRLTRWQSSIDGFSASGQVDVETLEEAFPGVTGEGGEFRAHLEIAALAIALKRRINVIQAVEHSQSDEGNVFESFTRALTSDQKSLDILESGISRLLVRISDLEVVRPQGLRAPVFTNVQVDRLLSAASRIRNLAASIPGSSAASDVEISIIRDRKGAVSVLPAAAI